MLPVLKKWNDAFDNIPLDDGSIVGKWAENLADTISGLTDGFLELGNPLVPPSPGSITYSFQKELFSEPLKLLIPTSDPVSGPTAIAQAWNTAALASIPFVPSGISVGTPPSPINTFSAPPIVIPDLPVFTKALVDLTKQLIDASKNPSQDPPVYPKIFLNAFKSLTYTVDGVNSVIPTPAPLVVPAVPVI